MSRIEELRALLNDYDGNGMLVTSVENVSALLDCAEALKAVLAILPVCPKNTGIVGIEARYNFAVVGARKALTRLNGDDHD